MGFFNFFSKEKKETLDKGLSKTKESVFSKIARAVAGKSKVDDEVLDNLEEVLITCFLFSFVLCWAGPDGRSGPNRGVKLPSLQPFPQAGEGVRHLCLTR